ncbi:MAG: ergothioneine biosynthesis protein EgtB [Cyclobacteriaceae bacterium]|nr:ergothioneine biosynthesis protein EgtB [Cyclobacteriaceae bacterium SS2]
MALPTITNQELLVERFRSIRDFSLKLCKPLEKEDYVVQPTMDVSPPKWHLAHTTWFFETFLLSPFSKDFKPFNKDYALLFNSYYIAAGERWVRSERGALTRPTVDEVLEYRNYVDQACIEYLVNHQLSDREKYILEVGLNHEQQHQELLLYDIKYILGHNPLFPAYTDVKTKPTSSVGAAGWIEVSEGIYEIGHQGESFCYDNETGIHKVYLHDMEIANQLVTNGEYLEFMQDGGYTSHQYWLSEGWDWVNREQRKAPLYWIREDDAWHHYTLHGLQPLDKDLPVAHISYYEAEAFATWKGYRLPTEFEWEVAARLTEPDIPEYSNFVEDGLFGERVGQGYDFFGNLWEWTSSPYRPYPYFKPDEGALGEYNGKFMINQMVLRGGSYGTSRSHIRHTYRNFFHPHLQWMFSGIRLARYK